MLALELTVGIDQLAGLVGLFFNLGFVARRPIQRTLGLALKECGFGRHADLIPPSHLVVHRDALQARQPFISIEKISRHPDVAPEYPLP